MASRSWRKERYRDRYNNQYFEPSEPLKAEGGIKSQSKRGEFGAELVGQALDPGARRLQYRRAPVPRPVVRAATARSFRSRSRKGRVTAKVQGSRPTPYDVTIEVKTLSESEWAKVLDALGTQAFFAAKLLAGEMPQDIEPVFATVGLSLFPAKLART